MSQSLFAHLDEVENRLKDASAVLLFVNFDGTLTPLADSPEEVELPSATQHLLEKLASQKWVMPVIISGRALADVQQRVGVPGLIYAGNHGLEIRGAGLTFVEPAAEECRETLGQLIEQLARRLHPIPGARVEDKGLTATVHFRHVPEQHYDEVRRQMHAVLANASHPFVLTPGLKAFEIRPRVYWNKGSAVNWLVERLSKPGSVVIYLGDDPSDEDAFTALPGEITIKVGGGETAAHYRVDGPEEVHQFLTWLDQELCPPPHSTFSPIVGERVG